MHFVLQTFDACYFLVGWWCWGAILDGNPLFLCMIQRILKLHNAYLFIPQTEDGGTWVYTAFWCNQRQLTQVTQDSRILVVQMIVWLFFVECWGYTAELQTISILWGLLPISVAMNMIIVLPYLCVIGWPNNILNMSVLPYTLRLNVVCWSKMIVAVMLAELHCWYFHIM